MAMGWNRWGFGWSRDWGLCGLVGGGRLCVGCGEGAGNGRWEYGSVAEREVVHLAIESV